MSKKLHHVKSICEKRAKQEWKEGQLKLNKKILSIMKVSIHNTLLLSLFVYIESLKVSISFN